MSSVSAASREPSPTRRYRGAWVRLATTLAAALLLAAPSVHAQNAAVLQGRIVSSSGAPVAGAQIGVLNNETRQQRGTQATSSGTYTVVGLEPGSYHVTVRMIGRFRVAASWWKPGNRMARMAGVTSRPSPPAATRTRRSVRSGNW